MQKKIRSKINPIEAAHYSKTSPHLRLRKGNNCFYSHKNPPPQHYDYDSLTAKLHPDQDAYRRWLIDIIGFILFEKSRQRELVRILEIGCATAHEMQMFLSRYSKLWLDTDASLEVHLLDIDKEFLSSAAYNINKYGDKNIKIFLWQGDLEKLTNAEYELLQRFPPSISPQVGFPSGFDLIFSQLTLHHFSWEFLEQIFNKIYQSLNAGGCWLMSDILYTGTAIWDSLILNRVLQQIEIMPEKDKKEFWLEHYNFDCSNYRTRKDLIGLMKKSKFSNVEILQSAYDMVTIAGIKKRQRKT